MANIIAIANQKGGIGKTTTAVNLAYDLKVLGKKVLLIDTDPQCNSTRNFRAEINGKATLYDLLFNSTSVFDCVQVTEYGDIIASDFLLIGADEKFPPGGSRFHLLKKSIEPIKNNYDYIIIDTPPSLGVLLQNVLTVTNFVIIPISCDAFALQGLEQLRDTISETIEYLNPDLKIMGMLLIKYHDKFNISKLVTPTLKELNEKLFHVKIRETIKLNESQICNMPVLAYDGNSNASIDYLELAKEIIEKEKE